MNLQDGVSLSESLTVTLFSMGIVFITLIIISLILSGFKLIFYKEATKEETPSIRNNKAVVDTKSIDDNETILAVIAAAIAADAGRGESILNGDIGVAIASAIAIHEKSNIENINIRSIRKIY